MTLLQVSLITGSVVSEFPVVVQNTMNDIPDYLYPLDILVSKSETYSDLPHYWLTGISAVSSNLYGWSQLRDSSGNILYQSVEESPLTLTLENRYRIRLGRKGNGRIFSFTDRLQSTLDSEIIKYHGEEYVEKNNFTGLSSYHLDKIFTSGHDLGYVYPQFDSNTPSSTLNGIDKPSDVILLGTDIIVTGYSTISSQYFYTICKTDTRGKQDFNFGIDGVVNIILTLSPEESVIKIYPYTSSSFVVIIRETTDSYYFHRYSVTGTLISRNLFYLPSVITDIYFQSDSKMIVLGIDSEKTYVNRYLLLGDKSIPYINNDPYFSLTELTTLSDVSNVKIAKWDSSGGIATPSLYYLCCQTSTDSIKITIILDDINASHTHWVSSYYTLELSDSSQLKLIDAKVDSNSRLLLLVNSTVGVINTVKIYRYVYVNSQNLTLDTSFATAGCYSHSLESSLSYFAKSLVVQKDNSIWALSLTYTVENLSLIHI